MGRKGVSKRKTKSNPLAGSSVSSVVQAAEPARTSDAGKAAPSSDWKKKPKKG